ncbi:MAG: HupE/UreJ family protein [Acidovorax sp.]
MKNTAKLLTAAALLLPALAFAHLDGTAHSHGGFASGLVHPFTGADHLAAMLAVGVWSALTIRPVWAAPLAFVALLAVGALAGFMGLAVPGVEPMIAASLLALGLLVAWRGHLPTAAAAALAGAFAFFHGAAHGSELGGDGQWAALLGMVVATAVLHCVGIALGRAVVQRTRWVQLATGLATALLGVGLLVRMA